MTSSPWLLAASLLLGCSADAAPEPSPTLETPGAFVATELEPGRYALFRTLSSLRPSNGEQLLFLTAYAPEAGGFEEARRLAQAPSLPVRDELVLIPSASLTSNPFQVVWFRTLTEEEASVLP